MSPLQPCLFFRKIYITVDWLLSIGVFFSLFLWNNLRIIFKSHSSSGTSKYISRTSGCFPSPLYYKTKLSWITINILIPFAYSLELLNGQFSLEMILRRVLVQKIRSYLPSPSNFWKGTINKAPQEMMMVCRHFESCDYILVWSLFRKSYC